MDTTIGKPIKKSKMAEAKLGWIIFYVLGGSSTLLSMFGDLAEPYKSLVSILSVIFLTITCLRAYEKWREQRITNNEREYNLKRKHAMHNNQNGTHA